MKVYRFFPILAVALLSPSFAEADHDDRGERWQYSDRDNDRYAPNRATYERRVGYDRGRGRGYDRRRGYDRGRRGKIIYRQRPHRHYDDHHYCDHHSHDHGYGHGRRGGHRRGRRGIHFGGVIVIRF